jgi:hypothetical protein
LLRLSKKLLRVLLKNIPKSCTLKISQKFALNKSLRVSKKLLRVLLKNIAKSCALKISQKFSHYTNNYSNFETILLLTEFNFE